MVLASLPLAALIPSRISPEERKEGESRIVQHVGRAGSPFITPQFGDYFSTTVDCLALHLSSHSATGHKRSELAAKRKIKSGKEKQFLVPHSRQRDICPGGLDSLKC